MSTRLDQYGIEPHRLMLEVNEGYYFAGPMPASDAVAFCRPAPAA